MKQYLVDQLDPKDTDRLREHLDQIGIAGSLPGIYRLRVPDDLLTSTQQDHTTCGPFYLAVEVADDRLACEFLVRASDRVRCDCMGYADDALRRWAMASVDAILEKLDIRI